MGVVDIDNDDLFHCGCSRDFSIEILGLRIGFSTGGNGGLGGNCFASTVITPPAIEFITPGVNRYVRIHVPVIAITRVCDTSRCGLLTGSARCAIEREITIGTKASYVYLGSCVDPQP